MWNNSFMKKYSILIALLFFGFAANAQQDPQFSQNLFNNIADFNYLFIRLGNVLILFGIFYAFESFLKHPVILKIGQRTLSIYVIHFIILYGSFTGWGLNRILGRSLNPKQAIFWAFAFLIAICLMAMFRTQFVAFLRSKINQLLELRKKSNN